MSVSTPSGQLLQHATSCQFAWRGCTGIARVKLLRWDTHVHPRTPSPGGQATSTFTDQLHQSHKRRILLPCREFSYASLPAMEPWQLWHGIQSPPLPPPLPTLLCPPPPPLPALPILRPSCGHRDQWGSGCRLPPLGSVDQLPPSLPPILPCLPSGHHVVIVTSGAVGVGCHRLGLSAKPSQLAKKQALAAVGQVRGGRGRRGGLR